MTTEQYLIFDGLSTAVVLRNADDILPSVQSVFYRWPNRVMRDTHLPVFAAVIGQDGGYRYHCLFQGRSRFFNSEADLLCALAADSAWAILGEQPGLLCLHCAAIEVEGRLLVIPNTHRAGKSTLTAILAARGHRVFTDDFLPLRVQFGQPLSGVGCGIAPRLRLPVPDDLSRQTVEFTHERTSIDSARYAYVAPKGRQLAAHGDSAPIAGIVLLDRDAGNDNSVTRVDAGAALKAMIVRNFSRQVQADGILAPLAFLATHCPAYQISATSSEQAADLLEDQIALFERTCPAYDGNAPRAFDFVTASARPTAIAFQPDHATFSQHPDAALSQLGEETFLTCPDKRNIFCFNDGSRIIWSLLETPMHVHDMVGVVQAAFPDIASTDIERDMRDTLRQFFDAGVVLQTLT